MILPTAEAVINILIGGLLHGGILSILAVGLTFIFGVSRVLNIAHGDFLFLGGATTTLLFSLFSVNPFLSVLIVLPLFAIIGTGFSYLMKKPTSARSPEVVTAASILVTLGLSNLIEGLGTTLSTINGHPYYTVQLFVTGTVDIFGFALNEVLLLSFVAIIGIAVAMSFLVYKTFLGSLMRAAMADREVAIMLGIDTFRISTVTFAIGISLSALAGTVEVMTTNIDANVGLLFTIQALTVIVLGGLASFYGALLAGFLIGVSVAVAEIVLGIIGVQGGAWADAVPLVMLLIILIVRPRGLLRR